MLPDYVKEVDLVALISSDLGAGVDTGKWTKFLCPWCRHMQRGAIKTFLLVTNEGESGYYFCKCCSRKGNALQWLKDYRRMDASKALDYLRRTGVKQRNGRESAPTAEQSTRKGL